MNEPDYHNWRVMHVALHKHNNIKFVKPTPRKASNHSPFEAHPKNRDVTWLAAIWAIVVLSLFGAFIK